MTEATKGSDVQAAYVDTGTPKCPICQMPMNGSVECHLPSCTLRVLQAADVDARLAAAEKLAKATQSFRNEVVEWIRDVEVGFPCNPYPADNVEEIKAIDDALAAWKEAAGK